MPGFRRTALPILLLLISLAPVGCGDDPPADFSTVEGDPDQEIGTFTLRHSENGRLSWELVAELAYVWDDEHQARAEHPQVEFYKDGEHCAVLTAEVGIVNMQSNDMEARGGVVVVADDGTRLETEVLDWDNKRQRIFTNHPLTFIKAGTRLTGAGFESDPDLTDWQINRPSGEVAPEELGGTVF